MLSYHMTILITYISTRWVVVRNNSPVTNGICSRAFHQDSIMKRSGPIMLVSNLIVKIIFFNRKLKCRGIGHLLSIGRLLGIQCTNQSLFIYPILQYMIWHLFRESIIALESDFSLFRGSIVKGVKSLSIWVGLLLCVFLVLPSESKQNLFLTSILPSLCIIKVISLLAVAPSKFSN